MKVKITTWKVSTLYRLKENINEQPVYQRGEVWKPRRKSILIDSMLRGIDIPKIYLRKLTKGAYKYEVADGQQRLTAICQFIENDFKLLKDSEKGVNLNKIGSLTVGGLKYDKLQKKLKSTFDDYQVTIAIITNATNQEIRTLFGRLQEGEPLVPAEKRNAIVSSISAPIDNFAINHDFFSKSKIKANRFKRQDYLSHALALIFYNNKYPLKAKLLLDMYLDSSITIDPVMQNKIANILDKMREIDSTSKVRIYKKYHFVDIFYFLYISYSRIDKLSSTAMATKFDMFESLRLANHHNPEALIENKKPTKKEKDIYEYLIAFRFNGADPESINTRLRVFKNLFK